MTRRSSLRAAAREIYGALAQGQAAGAAAPTPDPSPRLASAHSSPDGERPLAYGGGEKNDPPSHGSGEASLTARVRALYEESAVPVREIAQLCGVTERTIYKHAAKGAWTKRYRRSADVAPAKGAGGRFIRRADKGKPFAHGLKATDAPGRARAEAACGAAARLSALAQARAEDEARQAALLRAVAASSRAFADLARFRAHGAKARKMAREMARDMARARRRVATAKSAKRPWRAWQQTVAEPSKHLTPARRPPPPLSPHRHRIKGLLIRSAEIAVAYAEALLPPSQAAGGGPAAPSPDARVAHRMTPAH